MLVCCRCVGCLLCGFCILLLVAFVLLVTPIGCYHHSLKIGDVVQVREIINMLDSIKETAQTRLRGMSTEVCNHHHDYNATTTDNTTTHNSNYNIFSREIINMLVKRSHTLSRVTTQLYKLFSNTYKSSI